jgi:hypothetical protein
MTAAFSNQMLTVKSIIQTIKDVKSAILDISPIVNINARK